MEPGSEELQFPVLCHFRVIAKNIPHIGFVIETVLQGMGISAAITRERESAAGTYCTFSTSIEVGSREMLTAIDRELRAIEGVTMVL